MTNQRKTQITYLALATGAVLIAIATGLFFDRDKPSAEPPYQIDRMTQVMREIQADIKWIKEKLTNLEERIKP